ncbi:M81 family metallopeptidase [Mesorhizobium sp. 2RAF21]|uniref:M81 family metallopeptidase n=1 Tax=Mesorhizobium sp. 2RAF21 TaxID=3232995 RepID=UPI003F9AA46F
MKLFMAAVGTETNTFSPLPVGEQYFREYLWIDSDASLVSIDHFVQPLIAWRRMAAAHGYEVTESLSAFAQPGARTAQAVWETLRDALLADLAAAGKVDLVLLNLHGAMASSNCDDCEGDLLERVRTIVGPDTVVGVELDLHCHLTDAITGYAHAIVIYKEYPHTDVVERAEELFDICHRTVSGGLTPVMASQDCRMLGVWRTSDSPVRALVDWMKNAERRPGVLSISFVHGFPWADVTGVGARTLVVTNGDTALAQSLADELALKVWNMRTEYQLSLLSIDEAVAAVQTSPGLTVLADIADNAGCGSAGDSTFLLEAMLLAGIRNAIMGLFWDPVAVRLCMEAGEGAHLPLRLGGKISPLSGRPLDLDVRVLRCLESATVTFAAGRQRMGASVLVEASGIHIVVNKLRTQAFHPDAFTQFGVDLDDYRVVAVKSAQHFHSGFAPVADRIFYVGAPGSASTDFVNIKLPRAGRPLWPQVENPYAL